MKKLIIILSLFLSLSMGQDPLSEVESLILSSGESFVILEWDNH